MSGRNRRLAVLFAALAIVALLLLAAGLDGLELQPGRPLARWLAVSEEEGAGLPGRTPDDLLLVVTGLLLMLLATLALVFQILRAEPHKRWLYLLTLLLILLAFYLGMRAEPVEQEALPAATETVPEATPEVVLLPGPVAAPEEVDVQPPAWLVWLAAAILALMAAGLILGTAWLVWSRAHRPPAPLSQLAEQAQVALAELEAGAGVYDTVMRCYLEMSRIVEQERGLARGEAMTPREFEAALRGAGLPGEAVAGLTHLFEEVRYGTARPGRREEERAIGCLSAIVDACRSPA